MLVYVTRFSEYKFITEGELNLVQRTMKRFSYRIMSLSFYRLYLSLLACVRSFPEYIHNLQKKQIIYKEHGGLSLNDNNMSLA